MKNADKPAYPCDTVEFEPLKSNKMVSYNGLTKREAFAMAAMQGLLSDVGTQLEIKKKDGRFNGENFKTIIALNAIEFADELLKQLEP